MCLAVGTAMGENIFKSGWHLGGVPTAAYHSVHAHHGISCTKDDGAPWPHQTVFRSRWGACSQLEYGVFFFGALHCLDTTFNLRYGWAAEQFYNSSTLGAHEGGLNSFGILHSLTCYCMVSFFFLPLAAAIEKKNADCKGFHFSSSKRSGPFEILETCERLHSMEQSKLSSGASVVREKRHYDSTKRRSGQGNSDEPPCQLPWSSWRLQHQYPYISILAL